MLGSNLEALRPILVTPLFRGMSPRLLRLLDWSSCLDLSSQKNVAKPILEQVPFRLEESE